MIGPEVRVCVPEQTPPERLPYNITLQFLTAAQNAGIFEKALETAVDPRQRQKIQRGIDTVVRYYLTEASLPDIAAEDGVSVNESHRRRNFGIHTIWDNSPPFMQQFFSLDLLTLKKPLTEKAKRKISRAHNGKAQLIEQALLEGKPIELIKSEFDLSNNDFIRARRILNQWEGAEVPHNYKGYDGLDLAGQIENIGKLSPRHKQELLDSQTLAGLNKSQYFAKLKEVVETAGYKFKNAAAPIFAAELEAFEIPMRTTSYVIKKDGPKKGQLHRNRYVLRADLERAAWVLKYNPKFAKYKREDADW